MHHSLASKQTTDPRSRGASVAAANSFPVRAVLLLLRGYKLLLSPLFSGACRYVPSCSGYAAEAVTRFGVIAGGWLALKRLARCHPFAGAGFDPVPPNRGVLPRPIEE